MRRKGHLDRSTRSLYQPIDRLSEGKYILVINSGSSSLKLSLFNVKGADNVRLLDAHIKGINSDRAHLTLNSYQSELKEDFLKPIEISESLSLIFARIESHLSFDLSLIHRVGHRFVHGGGKYTCSTFITSTVLNDLEALTDLAPLHNAACLLGIKFCRNFFDKSISQVAVFDTAFYRFMPAVSANYAIPQEIALKYEIKRYGFHGISHAFLWGAYQKEVGENNEDAKIITLHLGNGCSMTAIQGGRPMDTSMGFTPAEGLIMSTRAGDVDAAVLEFLTLHEKWSPVEVMKMLNFDSGLLGVSGKSGDMKPLLSSYSEDERSRLAVDMFCYRVVKYLGAYIAALGGVEALIFSGGIGENSSKIRKNIIEKMAWVGMRIDDKANEQATGLTPGDVRRIGLESSIGIYVIATDENRFIADEVAKL